MFYCDPCAEKNDYPQSISKSNGKCELCNKNALCNDVHHSKLPVKKTKIDWEKEMKRCKESPYYYATTYLIANGKPFTTHLNEEQFNAIFGNCTFLEGNNVIVFNNTEWSKTGDPPEGNEKYYQEATVLKLRCVNNIWLADVKFKKSGLVSKGHFVSAMKHCEQTDTKCSSKTPYIQMIGRASRTKKVDL